MKPLFEEKQRFTQWWLWLGVSLAAIAVTAAFANALYIQLVLKQPWGKTPMSDEVLVTLSLAEISAVALMLMIFFNAVLEVTVDKYGISYRYFPLIRSTRRIEREDIQEFQIKTYYLRGYGIKRDLRGNKTINVKGHMGIQITTQNGKKLTLGTQKPDEFYHALDVMKKGSAE